MSAVAAGESGGSGGGAAVEPLAGPRLLGLGDGQLVAIGLGAMVGARLGASSLFIGLTVATAGLGVTGLLGMLPRGAYAFPGRNRSETACAEGRGLGWVAVAVVLLSSQAWSQRAWSGLRDPPVGWLGGTAQVVQTPEWIGGALRLRIRIHGARYESWLRGPEGARAARLSLGQRLDVEGRASRVRRLSSGHISAHVGASLASVRLGEVQPLRGLWAVADGVAARIDRAAQRLPARERPLYLGLVMGDDSSQGAPQRAAFRAAGLGHLLAVSGQNVAFVLGVCAPLVAALRPSRRAIALVAAIVVFALATRLEPSVVRASVMAGLALWARARGSPQSGGRLLAITCLVLTAIDPLLWWSVGFQLSVLATAGLIWLAPPIARQLGGGSIATVLACAIAAPIATLPITVLTFGSTPLVAIPANVLASAPAGWAMSVGLVFGLVGSVLPGWVAAPLLWSTEWSVRVVDRIAWFAARAGWPQLSGRGAVIIGLALLGCALVLANRQRVEGRSSAGSGLVRQSTAVVVGCGALAVAFAVTTERPLARSDEGCGLSVVAPGIVVIGRLDVECATALLSARGWTALEVVVLRTGSLSARRAAGELFAALPPSVVLSPPTDSVHRWVGEVTVVSTAPIPLGDSGVAVYRRGDELELTAARSPP